MSKVMESFECQRCGACCRWPGSVLVQAADIEQIAAFLGMTPEAFIDRHTILARNRAQLTLRETGDGACEFLDPDGRCQIYSVRPRQCRDFPYGWQVVGCPGLAASP